MEYRPHWMSLEWQKTGHDVLVVTGDHSHLRLGQPQVGVHTIEGVRYLTLRTFPYDSNGPRRFANILSFRAQLKWMTAPLVRWQPDVVIASSTHPMDVRPAVRVADRAGAKFVYEIHDLWPLTPRLLGGMSEAHPMIRWMQREEDFGCREAELCVSLLPGTEQYMVDHGLKRGRWVFVPNGIPDDEPEERPTEGSPEAIQLFKLEFPRVIVFAGGHAPVANLAPLLGQMSRLGSAGVGVVLVGEGPSKHELQQRFGRLPNVLFLDPVPRAAIPALLAECSVGYLGAQPIALYKYGVSPNKLFDYMAAGLPVIDNNNQESSLVAQLECGFVADPSDEATLAVALDSVVAMSTDELLSMGSRGRHFVRSELRQSLLAGRFLAALASPGTSDSKGKLTF